MVKVEWLLTILSQWIKPSEHRGRPPLWVESADVTESFYQLIDVLIADVLIQLDKNQ
ncbi:MAG: hypothetical protein AAF703_13620 [Cyanobacteria bacterium P01_D01_bin.105]